MLISQKANSDNFQKHVYVVDCDRMLPSHFIEELGDVGFKVSYFNGINAVPAAFKENIPDALILDKDINSDDSHCEVVLKQLRNEYPAFPPLVLISQENSIENRLVATRLGANRYFCRPINSLKMIHILENLLAEENKTQFRVLVIDNELQLLEQYATTLEQLGMRVEKLSTPLQILQHLEQFKPNVILLDVEMPECNGVELAEVIRQDDEWASIPIVFLAEDKDFFQKFPRAETLGDGVLIKPVDSLLLQKKVINRAKRAQRTTRLHRDLALVLRESQFLLTTMDHHELVSTTDTRGRITSVNEKFCEVSGYRKEELIGQNHRILKSGYHHHDFYQEMWKTIANGKVWRGTICNRKKSGEEYWVESTIVPFLDEKGKPYKYVSARTNVSELRLSEERLHRSQTFANIGTWDWNVATGELYWSERIAPLFGYIEGSLETTYDNFLAAVHPDDRELVTEAVDRCVNEGTEYNIEHRVVWPDGQIRWVQERGDVIRDDNQVPLHMLGVVIDIHERKVVEQSLIDAREEADNANRAKSQFLSSMSHELRTPLNAIMGYSQLLTLDPENPLNESQKENVNEISRAGGHLLNLINEILDLAKIETGNIELSIDNVMLGDVLTESLLLITPLAQKRNIDIQLQWNGEEIELATLGEQNLAIRADFSRLKQVFLNLLSNAVKYNRENGRVTIACYEIAGEKIRIDIKDTGAGIATEQQGQLFKAFNRLGYEQTDVEGTGIGLVITKNIVELMQGSIGVTSHVGEGSCFWVELPNNRNMDSLKIPEKNQPRPTSIFLQSGNKSHSVLYIEDNPANLRLVQQLLARIPGVKLWSAPEPLLGLELAIEHQPDVILLDINLPGMDGFEVLKLLKAREESRKTPIIAVSANAMPQDIQKGLDAGFDEYITKPINLKGLLEVVENYLNKL